MQGRKVQRRKSHTRGQHALGVQVCACGARALFFRARRKTQCVGSGGLLFSHPQSVHACAPSSGIGSRQTRAQQRAQGPSSTRSRNPNGEEETRAPKRVTTTFLRKQSRNRTSRRRRSRRRSTGRNEEQKKTMT